MLWLCQNCAKLVDNDTARFPETTLREWKQNAETEALASVGRTRTALSEEPSDATKRLSLMDERFKLVIEDYKKRGTPKYMIDTFLDLSRQEKAELYDRAIMWKKGRKSQNNPYLMSSSS